VLTYVVWALPTILLSIALGLVLGWLVWGQGGRRAQTSSRETLREVTLRRDRDLADRDATIQILREELAMEAAETAKLRRLLGSEDTTIHPALRAQAASTPDPSRSAAPSSPGPAPGGVPASGAGEVDPIPDLPPPVWSAPRVAEDDLADRVAGSRRSRRSR
jgi:hypothetical protein